MGQGVRNTTSGKNKLRRADDSVSSNIVELMFFHNV
jgi:hypothetical protein